jgi:hypothetical protein
MVDVVVAYWAYGERSDLRFGQVQTRLVHNIDSTGWITCSATRTGLSSGGAGRDDRRALPHPSGATNVDLGVVSVADCKPAPVNPKAHFYGKPIRLGDQQNSRWIAEPLRLPESL